MHVYRRARRPFRGRDTGDVIDMCVREKDVTNRQLLVSGNVEELRHRIARIDQHGLTRLLAGDDEAILVKRAAGANLYYHGVMVLAVVDDLMFASKIRVTARQLGVDVAFARSSDAAVDAMRSGSPALVIFDLNNPRTDPLGTVA